MENKGHKNQLGVNKKQINEMKEEQKRTKGGGREGTLLGFRLANQCVNVMFIFSLDLLLLGLLPEESTL